MWCCSDVAIVIQAKDNDKLLKAAKYWDEKHDLDGYYTVEQLLSDADSDVITKDGKYRLIVWRIIKWYAGVDNEKTYVSQEFFESLTDFGIKYDFVRIGAKMGDYETKKNLNSGLIYPDQSIWFNSKYI